MKKMKKDNKLFANCRFFLLGSFLLTSCNISSVSSEFDEILTTADYWESKENTALGTITYTQTFNTNGTYTIEVCYYDNSTDKGKGYNYSVGYYNPKYAFILYREDVDEDLYYIVGTPIYFYFDFENMLLVTSSNSNMSYPRKWTGYID